MPVRPAVMTVGRRAPVAARAARSGVPRRGAPCRRPAGRGTPDLGAHVSPMVILVPTTMHARQQEATLEVLQAALKSNAAPRCGLASSVGDILREHGPSLGKTPDPNGYLEPVILTSSRNPQRDRTFD
jgi:hypothetical protein